MSFGEVAASAIRFAREGFPTYPFLAEQLAARQKDFARWPSTAAIFLPDGRPPEVGEIFVQSDLARTLQYMADQERAHARTAIASPGLKAARDAFYRGDIAGAILRHQRENGGWLTEARSRGLPQPDRTAVPHPVRRVRSLWLRRLVAGADGAGGAEHPDRASICAAWGTIRPPTSTR